MTTQQKNKVQQSIKETWQLILKEEKYAIDLRKIDYLQSLYNHLALLNTMLEKNMIISKFN